MQRANYERRLLAYIFDIIFSLVFVILMHFLFTHLLKVQAPKWVSSIYLDSTYVTTCISLFVYVSLSYFLFNGVTLGGLIFNVRITNKDESKMSFKTCLMRSLLLSIILLSIYNLVYMLKYKTQIAFYDDATDTRAFERKHIEEYL